MTPAEEIRDGLDFLIKEAKEIDALVEGKVKVDICAQHDVFYASVLVHYSVNLGPMLEVIQAKMEELGWDHDEDDGSLTFNYFT